VHKFHRMAAQRTLWYCETVKNITVSVPDEVYKSVRIKAAEMETSVSALVRDYLTGLTSGKSDFEMRLELQNRLLAELDRRRAADGQHFKASERLSRDEIHDREALRRHERSAL